MSSSCIPTGLRLDLDMVKAATSPVAHSSPLRPLVLWYSLLFERVHLFQEYVMINLCLIVELFYYQ